MEIGKEYGVVNYEEEEIQMEFVSYLKNILKSNEQPSNRDMEKILEVISCLIEQEQIKDLEREVTQEEVKEAM